MVQSLAKITCPNCRQSFGASLEQVLDVEVDPSARDRLLSGQVNLVVCPHCGMGGMINVPFLYHDRAKELALVFLPMETGRTDLERQQIIGGLSRAVMNQLPPEQRKGYLLNPQVFFTYESLVKRVLEAEGITQEMIEAQQARVDLLRRLMEASSPEERVAIIRENEEILDEEFFRIFHADLLQAEAAKRQEQVRLLLDLRTMLFELTPIGRRLALRAKAMESLQNQPTRENLLELLISAPDEETRAALLSFGSPLLDYFFFQVLTQRIEATEDEEERRRLEDLREEVMEFRRELREQAKQVVDARAALVRELLTTEEPELLARRRLSDMDELFFNVLAAQIEQAREDGDAELASRLQEIWRLTMGLMQGLVPPELVLLTRVLEAKGPDEVRQVLEQNRQLVGPPFLELLRQVEGELRERGDEEAAGRAAAAAAVVQEMVGTGGKLAVA